MQGFTREGKSRYFMTLKDRCRNVEEEEFRKGDDNVKTGLTNILINDMLRHHRVVSVLTVQLL